jgi:hypothetical protein
MAYYWQISATMAAQCEGMQEGENVFSSVLTTDGRHVCAFTATLEFPHLFLGKRPIMLELSPADFPLAAGDGAGGILPANA